VLRQPCPALRSTSSPPKYAILALHGFVRTFERETNRPGCGKHSGRYLFLVLGGSLLARGLRYRAKLKNILGDLGDRPGFWSNLL
jgi:hypothetical protein